jgi:hypothetical protein
MEQDYKPFTVYYYHFVDERHVMNNWKVCRDYACCVMAKDQTDAIQKTRDIALSQSGAIDIKIMGIGHGKEEWAKLPQPMTTDDEQYRISAEAAIERARQNGIAFKEKLKYKFDL